MGAVVLPGKDATKSELFAYYQRKNDVTNEWIRRQIVENDRIDLLCEYVLGLSLKPFHLALLRWQFTHPENLQLVFRGAGKSTTCTIAKTIHLLVKNPNLRILIASKTAQNAEGFLKEIKGHFESNPILETLFGPYYDQRKVRKWDNREIEVLPRTAGQKEASVTCVGVDGTIVSKHYDVIIADDLVDEDNARTKYMRDKTKYWYYNTLMPTLEPPDPSVPHRGEWHHQGTRYHYDDLYGHLAANEYKGHTQIIPALDKDGRSPWPEKYPPEWFVKRRKRSGIIIFNAQYQCDTEAMKGEIFQYDCCEEVPDSNYPSAQDLRIFMGVDLAIGEKQQNDKFAIVVLGVTKDRTAFYCMDYYEGRLRFNAQTAKILEYVRRWKPIRTCIETNAYQKAQYQNVKEKDPDVRLKPVLQDTDKIARAWKLSSLFEENKMKFKKEHQLLVEHMVLFPNAPHDDLFDAYDLAVRASKVRSKRRRPSEPGLL